MLDIHSLGMNWQALEADHVPAETGLKAAQFTPPATDQSYTSPTTGENCWTKPGPKAGPLYAKLSDGSVVTHWWYRFIDQPALQNAGLSESDKAQLQAVVEKIQAQWTMDKEYLPPPGMGRLAMLDSALIVKPPKGLERGFVPIATRQAPR